MGAEFNNNRGEYTPLQPFKYWCEKILPLTYDDSVSYYELLCKVVEYLNYSMDDVTTLNEDMTSLYESYAQLQNYVNTYFDNLDVQQEINNKLDAMVVDGTLTRLVRPFVGEAVSDWLEDNVEPTGSVVLLDRTMTVRGAAADAEAVGYLLSKKEDILAFDDAPTAGSMAPVHSYGIKNYVDGAVTNVEDDITDLKEDLNNINSTIYSIDTKDMSSEHIATLTAHAGYYINTNVAEGGTVSLEPLPTTSITGWAIYDCLEGEEFTLTGKGGNGSRVWAFVDEDNKMLSKSDANLIQDTPVNIVSPANGKLICNVTSLTNPLPTLTRTYKVSNIPYVDIAKSKYNKGILDIYTADLTGWYSGLNTSYEGKWDSDNIPTGDGFGYMTTYAHVIEKFDALMALDTGYVTKNALGTASGTDTDNNPYIIYEYVFSPKRYASDYNNRVVPKILLQCCAHGFEKNACYGTYYFLYDLVNNWTQNNKLKILRQSVEFHVIPVLNPYGFDNDQYYNANGVNINRNYNVPNWTYYPPTSPSDSSGEEPFDQPETAIVKAWVEANTDALMLADIHTNGHYYSGGYNNANPLMPVTGITDEYYNQLFGIFVSQIEAQSLQLPKEFNSIALPSGNTDASFWGRIQSEDVNLGKGHANIWCTVYENTLSFTLEVCNGLKVDNVTIIDYMSADAKKISSEVIGNTICEIIKRYAFFDVKT